MRTSFLIRGGPKMAAGAEAFLKKTLAAGRPHCRTRASCWKRLERENVHASVALADVWTVLERGLLLDRLKRARRRDPRRKDGAASGFDSENWLHRNKTHFMRSLVQGVVRRPAGDSALPRPPSMTPVDGGRHSQGEACARA